MTNAKPLKLSEKQVTSQCVGWLRTQRYFCVRLNSGLMTTPAGRRIRIGEKALPDWAVFHHNNGWLLELKATGKRPSLEQAEMHRTLKVKHGIEVIWADSLERLREQLP